MDPQKISEKFGPPSTGKVTRRDGQPRDEGIPEYLVEPIEYKVENLNNLRDILLIDFGECKMSR